MMSEPIAEKRFKRYYADSQTSETSSKTGKRSQKKNNKKLLMKSKSADKLDF